MLREEIASPSRNRAVERSTSMPRPAPTGYIVPASRSSGNILHPVSFFSSFYCNSLSYLLPGTRLGKDNISILRSFALKLDDNLSDRTYAKFRFAFPDAQIESLKLTKKLVIQLSGFLSVQYDCCIKSCMCYCGPFVDLNSSKNAPHLVTDQMERCGSTLCICRLSLASDL